MNVFPARVKSETNEYLNEDRPIVSDAENAFVARKFRKALKLANEFLHWQQQKLQGDNKGASNRKQASTDDVIHLCIPLSLQNTDGQSLSSYTYSSSTKHDRYFSVTVSNEISSGDRAAVVALQSYHEMRHQQSSHNNNNSSSSSKRTRKQLDPLDLVPFLDFYSDSRGSSDINCDDFSQRHTMPVEVAIVWIQFSYALGGARHILTAVELAAELVHHMICLTRVTYTDDTNSSTRSTTNRPAAAVPQVCDELVWFLLTKALSRSKHPNQVSCILDRVFQAASSNTSWAPPKSDFVSTEEPNALALSHILSQLKNYGGTNNINTSWPTEAMIAECREHLSLLLLQKSDTGETQHEQAGAIISSRTKENKSHCASADTCTTPGAAQPYNNSKQRAWMPSLSFVSLTNNDWKIQFFAKHLLRWVRRKVIEPLYLDEERWAHGGRTAMVFWMVYFGWKRRRHIGTALKYANNAALSPFVEIMDALSP